MDRGRLELETLKLLVSIAWADREISTEEQALILALARQAGTSDADLQYIAESLRDSGRLPAPDLTVLREAPEDALRAVDVLVAIDGRVLADELDAREAVATLLNSPSAARNDSKTHHPGRSAGEAWQRRTRG